MITLQRRKYLKFSVALLLLLGLYLSKDTLTFAKLFIHIIPTERFTKMPLLQKVYLAIASPEKLAIALSDAGEEKLIYIYVYGRHGPSPESGTWGVRCNSHPNSPHFLMSWDSLSPPEYFRAAVERYNQMVVTMPDFSAPHKCQVDGEPNSYIGKKDFLADLGISNEDYMKHRLTVETSSIYAASYFGHASSIQDHIRDINECDGEFYPIHYAKLGGHAEAENFLYEHGASSEFCGTAIAF